MFARSRPAVLAALGGLLACVAPRPPASRLAVLDARIEDARGGLWTDQQAPRRPHVVLQLAPSGADLEGRVFWIDGDAEPALLEDLADPPLRAATEARLRPVEIVPVDGGSRVQPREPLEPGAQSTLVLWTGEASEEVQDGFWQLSLLGSSAPDAGARLAQSLPPDGATDVSPAARRALLRWDGFVAGLNDATATLDGGPRPEPLSLSPTDCEALSLAPGSCLWLDLPPLAADTTYRLRLDGALQDGAGEAVEPPELTFTTTAATQPPAFAQPGCALDEVELPVGCARATGSSFVLRVTTPAPALVKLAQENATVAAILSHDVAALTLPLGGPGQATLQALDLTGRVTRATLDVWRESDWPRVAIAEVAATTLGSDAHNEYVEVVNRGERAQELLGWALSRSPSAAGARVESALELAPGGHALLVGPDFDPSLRAHLPSGLPRARLTRALGLPADGGPLWLRDALDRRVDGVKLPETPAGRCASPLEDGRIRIDACHHPEREAP